MIQACTCEIYGYVLTYLYFYLIFAVQNNFSNHYLLNVKINVETSPELVR